jgi:glycosyltransferase involved in cell wall biosynthesis
MSLYQNLNLRSPFNFVSGYSTILDVLFEKLPKRNIQIYPITLATCISEKYKKYFDDKKSYDWSSPELLISPVAKENEASNILFRLNHHKNRHFFTMWEATNIEGPFIEELNKCKSVIVPNKWNAYHFKRCGVNVPIKVIPLFVDGLKYKKSSNTDFVFGTANGDLRKNIDKVIKCFLKAFPNEKKVRLKVKTSTHDNTNFKFIDPRIECIKKDYTKKELMDWYHSLDVFVSGATAEGWGLMQHEAMACGRPVMATQYAGLAEFLTEENGFPLLYKEVPATGYWSAPGGKWSEFDETDMINQMRYCFKNRKVVMEKGIQASKDANQFTTDRFISSLIKELYSFQ